MITNEQLNKMTLEEIREYIKEQDVMPIHETKDVFDSEPYKANWTNVYKIGDRFFEVGWWECSYDADEDSFQEVAEHTKTEKYYLPIK